MIQWRKRIRNKTFWLALIPAVLLLCQQVAELMGVRLDLTPLQSQLTGLTGTVFSILALLGIVADPTTPGLTDPKQEDAVCKTDS